MTTQQDNKQYEYFAFISYKREDEKWAKWLQHKLEYYKLPSTVRKDNPKLPKKIRPVFKDTTDLEPGVLAHKIQNALDQSKFLIVICSPRSANSVWVSKEVQSFIDSGRADHIIPFIIGGTPNAIEPKDECFPEGLRQLAGEQELLGANINEMGREAASIKVVARMFNLRFDVLWQRFERDRKKRIIFLLVITILSILAVFGIGYLYIDRNLAYDNLTKANIEITKERNNADILNKQLTVVNDSIGKVSHELLLKNDSLNLYNDSISKVSHELLVKNDSLNLYNKKLLAANHEIIIQQNRLEDANRLLTEETKRANSEKDKMLANFANQLIPEDSYGAMLISLDILERNNNNFPDAEAVLRTAQYINNITLRGHTFYVNDFKFSPDGLYGGSASADETVKFWDLNNGQCQKTLKFESPVIGIQYSNDGNQIYAITQDRELFVYDITEEKFVTPYPHEINIDEKIQNVVFSKKLKYIAVSGDHGRLQLIDGYTKEILADYAGSKYFCDTYMSFNESEDKVCWINTEDKTVHILDINTLSEANHQFNYNANCQCMTFNPDGTKIFIGFDSFGKFLDANTFTEIETIEGENFESATYINDGANDILITSNNGTIKGWNTYSNLPNQLYYTGDNRLDKITFGPYLRYFSVVSSRSDGNIRIFDSSYINDIHSEFFICQKFEKYIGRSFIIENDNQSYIALKDLNNNLSFYKWNGFKTSWDRIKNDIEKGGWHTSAFSPSGKYFVTSLGDSILISDTSNGKLIKSIHTNAKISKLNFPNINRDDFITLTSNDSLQLWSMNNIISTNDVKKIRPDESFDLDIFSNQSWFDVIISPDLKVLYKVDDLDEKSIIRINLKTTQADKMYISNNVDYLHDLSLDPSGRLLIFEDSNSFVYIFDTNSQVLINRWKAHNSLIEDIKWHPSSQYVLTAGSDKTTKIWDVMTGVCVKKLNCCINDANFSSDGSVISGHVGYNYVLYDFSPITPIVERNKNRFKGRVLTPDEKSIYHLGM